MNPSPGPGQPPPLRVVLVDDDGEFLRRLGALLDAEDQVRVVGAFSDGTRLDDLALVHANVALVDVQMPRIEGPAVVARLRARFPALACVMLTSHDSATYVFASLRAGAVGYLLKTLPLEGILDGLREAVAGGAPMSPGVARLVVRSFAQPAAAAGGEPAAELTDRERELLGHVARGLSDKEVAGLLGISVWTVKNHLRHIYEKLHVRCRTEAAAWLRGSGPG